MEYQKKSYRCNTNNNKGCIVNGLACELIESLALKISLDVTYD